MKSFISNGKTMRGSTGSARSAGDVVVETNILGIVQEDASATETPVLAIEGVYRLPKTSATVIAIGERVDWDASAGTGGEVSTGITPAAGDVQDFGIAMAAAGNGAVLVDVKLTPGTGTFT